MEKILFSLKTDFNARSDAVGLPLLMILYADFYSHLFKYQVEVFDPFFELDKHIKNYNFKVVKNLNMNFIDYKRISNPLFYVSSLSVKNSKKIIKVEGKKNLGDKILFKKNELRLIQRTGLNSLGYLNKFNECKSLDIPYQYYLEWLFRDSFISKIKLKKKFKLPILKKNTYAVQFDYYFKKNPKLAFDIIYKIKKDDKDSNILIYGQDKNNYQIDTIKSLTDFGCIFLEDYSDNSLVRGLILGNNANYYISKTNGFTDFAMTIGKYSKKFKKSFYVDHVIKSDEITGVVRRNLRDGILENKISKNSFYFNKVSEYLSSKEILKKNNFFSKIVNRASLTDKSIFIGYSSNSIKNKFFSDFFDEIINLEMLKELGKNLKSSKLIFFKNSKFYDLKKNKTIPKSKIDLKYAVHVLSHYKLVDFNQRDRLLDKSLDFNKPDFLKKIINKNLVGPGNIFYEDLYSFFLRKCSNKNFNNQNIKKRTKKILVLTEPTKITGKKNYFNYILKKFLKNKPLKNQYDWNLISKKVEINYQCKLNFLFIKDKFIMLKIDNKVKRLILSKNNIQKILKKYETVICLPNHISLIIKFLSNNKNNLIYFSNSKDSKDIVDHDKRLFVNDYKFKYSDIFDVKFNDLTEMFLYLFKKYIKIT